MNGEIPSVPITTLAGVSSLVDLLPEMPLPTPLPQTLSNKSLLFHPRVAEEAQRLLSMSDDNLIPQLIQSLSMTSSKHIDLKDQYNELPLDHPTAPRLLAGIIHRKPDVFKGKHVQQMMEWSHNNQSQVNSSSSNEQICGNNNNSIGSMSQQSVMHSGMIITPIDLHVRHHPHHQQVLPQQNPPHPSSIINSDTSLHMMTSLDFISGLQSEQPSSISSNKGDREHDLGAGGQSMYNPLRASTSSNATSTSVFKHGFPPTLNHHPHASSPQKPVVHPHHHPYQHSPSSMSPSKSSSSSTAFDNNVNNNPSSGRGLVQFPPQQHLQQPHQNIPHHLPNLHEGGGGGDLMNFTSSSSHLPMMNSHYPVVPPSLPLHNNSPGVAPVPLPPNTNDLLPVHKIAMNVPLLKLESKSSKSVEPLLVNHHSVPPPSSDTANSNASLNSMKELMIKLDRGSGEVGGSSSRTHNRRGDVETTSSSGYQSTSTTPTTSGSSEPAMMMITKTPRSKKQASYKQESSGDEYEGQQEEEEGDDEQEDYGRKSKGNKAKVKRKKRESKDSEYSEGGGGGWGEGAVKKRKISSAEQPSQVLDIMEPKKKVRKFERMLVPVLQKLPGINVLDNSTYHRFLKTMDIVLESIDYADVKEIEMDDDGNVPSELLISKSHINELCSEAAKLKTLGAMEAMPTDRIVKLLSLLEINIRDGCKVTPLADPEDNDEESRLWMELTMDSISRGVMASLAALHILTSSNMPKRVYQEDLIDRIVIFSKFQLQNTVFATFDPVYRIGKRSKGDVLGSSNKKKRAHAREVREKGMLTFYTKMHEVVGLLAELLNVQVLTDTTVLHLSTLGVSPFFVENVSELQLSALKLVTGIFTHYEKHRRLLLEDILASIARLPSSKRSLRTFKLSAGSDECIQMLTALVLQLIQCVTHLPDKLGVRQLKADPDAESGTDKQSFTDKGIYVSDRFDLAMRTAGNFLAVFLNKCGTKSEDCDYRVLFENFVQDLLSTVNKPEWPAAELLLSLLGNLLVKNLGNKGLEVSMRVASLEYLGVAAARLRKDAVSAQKKLDTIDRIIADIRAEEEKFGDLARNEDFDLSNEEDKVEFLQRLLLDYLAVNGQSDPALMQSRHFYICSWWRSAQTDISKSIQVEGGAKSKQKKRKQRNSSSEEESDNSVESEDEKVETASDEKLLQLVERRRKFLLTKIRPFTDPLMTSRKTEVVQTFVDYQSAELITRYLASKRPFSASFDYFLQRILSVSTESTVALRTKALRCLTMVVEADPSVLARHDMELWVQHSFLDQSTAVREAAVDLVGKYVLSCPDLIEKYYDTFSLRILDTGVSVRKRVIKILRDVCMEHPTFPKIPEICVKMIRRVNDEEGIRKLVMEVFQNMWFSPIKEEDTKSLLRKVSNITEVVASCEKIGLDFFEQLLLSLFKPKDDKEDAREKVVNPEPPKSVLTASVQIVNCLVEHVLHLENESTAPAAMGGSVQSSSSQRFVACVATLYLFAKIRPQLLVNHAITLVGYLSVKCQNAAEVQAIANIAAILELVVPLLVNPSDSFLAQLEEDCVKLIFRNDKGVIESCLACLGAVVNKITHNYALVRDVFRRFQTVLFQQTKLLRENPNDPKLTEAKPRLRRAIYTVGMFLRYFDFMQKDVHGDLPFNTVKIIFSELMYLVEMPTLDPVDLQFFSLQAVGNMCIRHYDFMLGEELKRVYQNLLTSCAEIKLKTQALCNIQLYLTEEELRMIKQDQEWRKSAKSHDIKEMGDVTSGMASTIVQIYLKQILEGFLHREIVVRLAAVRVIQLVLQQGLVHPIQIVPYLICMSTDEEPGVSTTADKQLQEMEKKHPQFLQSQVLNGVKLSLQLQRILAGYSGPRTALLLGLQGYSQSEFPTIEADIPIVRGFRIRQKEQPLALNGFLYSLLRSIKPQRRAIALSLLKQFDDQNKTRLADLLYYCDNLAYFPYQVVDEPLFIIHHVDIVISVTGSNLLQSFKESLLPAHPPKPQQRLIEPDFDDDERLPCEIVPLPFENGDACAETKVPVPDDDDEDDDVESILQRIPPDTRVLEECIIGSQGCLLLLMLKQHLKETYGLTDAKISGYSPSDASKAFERPANRKTVHVFDPKCTLANLRCPPSGQTEEGRKALVEQYIHFKQLMLRIDPDEAEEDGEAKPVKLKIDQNLFTYSNVKVLPQQEPPYNNNSVVTQRPYQPVANANYNTSPVNMDRHSQYAVVPNIKQPVEQVRIPKLKIVPLSFPGNDNSSKKAYKVKDKEHHHHHHKHKKSKHKKKKRHTISDDSDSDNSDDPDFRI